VPIESTGRKILDNACCGIEAGIGDIIGAPEVGVFNWILGVVDIGVPPGNSWSALNVGVIINSNF